MTTAALLAPVRSDWGHDAGAGLGSIASRGGRWGGSRERLTTPSPNTQIATAPASVQTARNARPRPGLAGSTVRRGSPAIRAPASYRLAAVTAARPMQAH